MSTPLVVLISAIQPGLRRDRQPLTIDTEAHPPKILLIRGRAELDVVTAARSLAAAEVACVGSGKAI